MHQQRRFEFTVVAAEPGSELPYVTECTALLPAHAIFGASLAAALRFAGLGPSGDAASELCAAGEPLADLHVGTWPLVTGSVLTELRFHRAPLPPTLVLVALCGPYTGAVVQPAPGQAPFTDLDAAGSAGYFELTDEDLFAVTGERRVLYAGDTVDTGTIRWLVTFAKSTPLQIYAASGSGSAGESEPERNVKDQNAEGEPGGDKAGSATADVGAGPLLARAVAGEPMPDPAGVTQLALSAELSLPLQPGSGLILQGPRRHNALLAILVQLAHAKQPALLYGDLPDLPLPARFLPNFRLVAGMEMANEGELAVSVSATYQQQPAIVLAYGAMAGAQVVSDAEVDLVNDEDFERFARLLGPSVITDPGKPATELTVQSAQDYLRSRAY